MVAKALSGRARWLIIGSVVVLGAYLLFFTPVRTYFDQRGQMSAEQDRYELLASQNEQLRERAAELQREETVQRIAREKYELVQPGQQAYAVMPPPTVAPPAVETDSDDGLWDKLTFWD